MREPDWYCEEVIPGKVAGLVVLQDTSDVLAFRPPRQGFGTDHAIVIPKQHVRSLLELEPSRAAPLLAAVQRVAAEFVALHGGCQVLTNVGDQQHNRHLHFHVAAGDGVARFVDR